MTDRINRWLVAVLTLAAAGAVFIGEDAREPNGPLPIDRTVLRYAVDHRTSAWITVARFASHTGDPVTLAGLAVVATVLLWVRRHSLLDAAIPVAALVIAGAVEFITKRIIGRPRPPVIYHLLPETDPSFPSGHATGSAAFFVALALVMSPRLRSGLGRIALVLAGGVLAASIGLSRVVLGVHWLTDIAAGWLLGVAVAAGTVLVGHLFLPPLADEPGPMATPRDDEGTAREGAHQVWDDVPVRNTHARHALRTAFGAILVAGALVSCGAQSDSAVAPTTKTSTTATKSSTTAAKTTTATAPTVAAGPCGSSATPPKRYEHVVMMLEENRTWDGGRTAAVGLGFSAAKMPYLHGLAQECSYYTDWSETDGTQNSLNQYIGLTSGVANDSTVNDCTPSATCRSTDDNIFRQIRNAGGTPRTYVDGADAPCSVGTNKAKHIPALYYQGGEDGAHCAVEVRPLTELDPDHLPTFAFIAPDQCHDGHDCDDTKVDAFAAQTLKPILDGSDYAAGKTLVVVVYDEDQPVPNLLIAPTAHAGAITTVAGSHAALLKTIETMLGLPVLAQGQLPAAMDLRSSAHL